MMLFSEIFVNPIISSLFSLSITILTGLLIGEIKIGGVKIGIAGTLFSGIILSYFGIKYDENVLHFLRDFGLILFVSAIGMQVGTGFFSSFKKNGILLNFYAFIVVLGNIILLFIIKYFLIDDSLKIIGLYCGAVTNTPALASAQDSIRAINNYANISDVTSSYAIAYPGAIFAIILAMIVLKKIFKIDLSNFQSNVIFQKEVIENRTILIENPNINMIKISQIPAMEELNIIITRLKRGDKINVALPDTLVMCGDIILAVGKKENLDKFEKIVGKTVDVDLKKSAERIVNTRVVVTNKSLIGKKISETLIPSYGVVVTRVSRSDVEFLVSDEYEINFADQLVLVGEEDNVKRASSYIGNSPKELNHPHLMPIFIGIIFGIIIGSIPFSFPFISKPIKLGLAGGLLVSAVFFSNLHHIGKISWYIPPPANIMLRELGIVIFLSSVGLKSGDNFFTMLFTLNGFYMVILGFLISFLPVFIVGFILIKYYKQNYLGVCGLMSGSMTDPPALAWAQSLSDSSLVSMYYASVYPLTMFLRIISAQILVMIFYD
ncbi:MAG: putative transporter [Candidatus Goldbacteria bacterium]|nr:putative transporter [Candidatus Goldiibacteriota bacterium]